MLKLKLATVHDKAKAGYAYAEHSCAVLYALCEYTSAAHPILLALSLGLLGLGLVVVAVRLAVTL